MERTSPTFEAGQIDKTPLKGHGRIRVNPTGEFLVTNAFIRLPFATMFAALKLLTFPYDVSLTLTGFHKCRMGLP